MEDTELAVIPREDFMELINNYPQALKRFVQLLASDITRHEERLLNMAYNSLRRKVADALLALQPNTKTPTINHSASISVGKVWPPYLELQPSR